MAYPASGPRLWSLCALTWSVFEVSAKHLAVLYPAVRPAVLGEQPPTAVTLPPEG